MSAAIWALTNGEPTGHPNSAADVRPEWPNWLIARAAAYLTPCPAPDVAAGEDTCAHGSWPCEGTQLAWLLRGLDPDTEAKRLMGEARARMLLMDAGTLPGDLEPEPDVVHHAVMRGGAAGTECGTRRFWELMTRGWKDVTCPDCLAALDTPPGGAPC